MVWKDMIGQYLYCYSCPIPVTYMGNQNSTRLFESSAFCDVLRPVLPVDIFTIFSSPLCSVLEGQIHVADECNTCLYIQLLVK